MGETGLSDPTVAKYALEQLVDCLDSGDIEEALGHLDVARRSLDDLEAVLRERV